MLPLETMLQRNPDSRFLFAIRSRIKFLMEEYAITSQGSTKIYLMPLEILLEYNDANSWKRGLSRGSPLTISEFENLSIGEALPKAPMLILIEGQIVTFRR
jgi:hypothetical protein